MTMPARDRIPVARHDRDICMVSTPVNRGIYDCLNEETLLDR